MRSTVGSALCAGWDLGREESMFDVSIGALIFTNTILGVVKHRRCKGTCHRECGLGIAAQVVRVEGRISD